MDIDEYIKEPLSFSSELDQYIDRRSRPTIFEIGSCEGEDSIRLNKKFPNSAIYTFEPLPENVKKIKKNFERYGLLTDKVFQLALSDKDGSADFFVSSGHPEGIPKTKNWDYGNKSSSLLPPKEHKNVLKWVKFNKKIKVQTKRLDTFCREHSIGQINFMYLDVQGAELTVLQGAGSFLRKIDAIWMEVESVELYKGQPLKSDVEKFMRRKGFTKIIDTVDDVSGDQLYINNRLTVKVSRGQSLIKRLTGRY